MKCDRRTYTYRLIHKSHSFDCIVSSESGIFYGTSTGSTGEVADLIADAFGDVATEPIEVEEVTGEVGVHFSKYEALIVGTPTWNTGADSERSGTGWDEIYYGEMNDLGSMLNGKKVAVFGLGDSVSYGENFADASGELHDVFQNLGCEMIGYTSQDGYLHSTSKAIRGDLFCGLLNDAVNQEDLIEERVEKWVEQLKSEGILGGEKVAVVDLPPVPTSIGSTSPMEFSIKSDETKILDENSRILLEETLAASASTNTAVPSAASTEFKPHYNAKTGVTMWTSPDGRSSYFTFDGPKTSTYTP